MSDKGDSAPAISSFTCIGENGRKEGVGGGGGMYMYGENGGKEGVGGGGGGGMYMYVLCSINRCCPQYESV